MYKAKQKTVSLIVTCLTFLFTVVLAFACLFGAPTSKTVSAAEQTETLDIIATEGSLSGTSISWSGEHFTFTNNKGSSTTAIRTSDSDHYRVYANSNGSIASKNGETIITVVITCTSNSYATACKNSFGDIATVSGSTVTLTPAAEATSVEFAKATAQWRLKKIVVTYTEASSEPECTHEGYETAWGYDEATKEHYQTCINCETELDGTRAACSEFTYGEYTTANGVHTRTATCTVCGGAQTESGNCEIEAGEYIREGNQHSQTGTCTVCGDETTVTENCTLTYENVSNDDKTHNMTSTCSVCEQSATTENVNCTFDNGVLDGTTMTYTCEYCGYSYTETVATYTVTFVVPDGIAAEAPVEVAEGFTTVLPVAETVDGYTFAGWVESELAEKTEVAPTFYKANEEYTVTDDVTFYALYSYTEGTGAFTLVTDATKLAVGSEIVIVASGSDYALGTNQASNNRTAVEVTKTNDIVTWTTDVQVITLEEGLAESTWAFHVEGGTGTNAANGYLYATGTGNHLRTQTSITDNSSWNISIADAGIATIKANLSSGQNWLRKNSSNPLFACYTSGQNNVSIYMKDGATYYVTAFNTCAHENVNEVIEAATCTENGSRTVTCLDCDTVIEAEILTALGHNYVDGVCTNENCGKQDPSAIVYDGYYYLSLNGMYAGEMDGDNYKLFDTFTPNETIDLNYVFYFVKNNETYTMYNCAEGLFKADVTITTQDDYTVRITNSDDRILSLNPGYTTYNRMAFYAPSNNYPCDITLTEVTFDAHIDSASITVGEDLKMNYKVSISDALAAKATMYFTVDEKTYDVVGVKNGDVYVYSFRIAPQYMAANIVAELKYDDTLVIASQAEYSVKAYAQNKLNAADSSAELKQLVTDMLYYGAAAQNFTGYGTNNLATDEVANLGTASTAMPEATDFDLVKNDEIDTYDVWFTAATVYFGDVNNIAVKLSSIDENVKLTINGTEVAVTEVAIAGNYVLTGDILATGFDDVYTFELSYNGVVMQTLTYSVRSYVWAKENDVTTGALAKALYGYGESAKAYKATLNA